MKHLKLLSGTAVSIIASSGVAQADVTAADVWQAWQDSAAAVGQTLTPGSEQDSGGVITITDLEVAMQTSSTSVTTVVPSMTFTENGDGTVSIALADSYDMNVSLRPEDTDEEIDLTINVASPDIEMTASGEPDAISYVYGAPEMVFTVASLVVDGETIEIDAAVTASTISGAYVVSGGDDSAMTGDFEAESVEIVFDMMDPEGGDGFFKANLTYQDMAVVTEGAMMMLSGGATELPDMLAAGGSTNTKFTHGPATFDVDFRDRRDAFKLIGSAATGLFDVALSAEALSYAINNTDLQMTMSGSEIPVPELELGFGELGFGFLTPVSKSETEQDFGLEITMADLEMSDMLWSLIDPGDALPHDPATLIVDIAGKGNLFFDMFNPDSMMEVEADLPGELHELNINQIRLAVLGGDLTGEGAFTFNNEDLATFDGLPAPTGTLSLQLVGANAVIDNLIAAGLVPEDQAMGARMMLGLFARPGDGEDTLVSEIEVDGATGAISANGQRLQ
ncbi:MAG: DUF2125 domain-containing protein [Pseudomonadota bacterium]